MFLSKNRHPTHTHLDSETFFQVSHKLAFYLPKTRYNKAKCNASVRAKCSPMPCQPHSCLQASTQTLSGHRKHCSSIQWEALESNSLVFFPQVDFLRQNQQIMELNTITILFLFNILAMRLALISNFMVKTHKD